MKTSICKKHLHLLPALAAFALLSLLLSACGGIAMSSSPEAAAIKEITNQSGGRSGVQIDPNSIQVLQTTMLDDQAFVLVSYEGVRSDLGGAKTTCLSLYGMRKALLGMWSPGSGNSGCESKVQVAGEQTDQPEPPPQPISIGGGRSGGDGKSDPGHSMASGKVFDDAVKAVKVTWQDGTSQQADVINASYLIVRTGQMEWMKVEALGEKGDVIFSWHPEVAPGKQ